MSDWMDLDEDPGLHVRKNPSRPTANPQPVTNLDDQVEYIEQCDKCNGTGRWRGGYGGAGNCFKCKGKGRIVRKTAPEVRAKAKATYQKIKANRAANLARSAEEWRARHANVAAWIDASAARGFGFAVSVSTALANYGSLTEKQLATCERLACQEAERRMRWESERKAKQEAAPAVSVAKIEIAIANAKAEGKSQIRLRLDTFTFSPASQYSRNPGAIYVKEEDSYLGKIQNGRFFASADCSELTSHRVVRVASDPRAAAVAYGRRTGNCACCGRLLTNQDSIDLGIGPICAGRFGW